MVDVGETKVTDLVLETSIVERTSDEAARAAPHRLTSLHHSRADHSLSWIQAQLRHSAATPLTEGNCIGQVSVVSLRSLLIAR